MSSAPTYPVQVDGELQPELSRWLWLVKWILAIPHAICLVFLWLAFTVLTVVAFVAVFVTGRYPRSLYAFNVGVLRWTWRVAFYTLGAFGTDRYPPFTLADVPDYPARLEIAYPEHLARGFRLLGRWLLGIPHYIIAGAFAGGWWVAWRGGAGPFSSPRTDRLPGRDRRARPAVHRALPALDVRLPDRPNRWVLRTAAYAALLTDAYPPFRFDAGEHELAR